MTWPHHAQHSNSAQNDDESDVEVLDLFGRKHVNRVDNADGIYLLQNDTETVHTFFRTPGMESADALRQFLAARLPEELVTDEYGCIVPIAEISGDHLPKLQAQLWLSENDKSGELLPSFSNGYTENQVRIPAPQRRSNTTRPPPQKPSAKEDLLRIACHVTFIAELLQANHIFICSDTGNGVCELSFCPSRSNDSPRSRPIITMEPLIHWATVTPANDTSTKCDHVQVFQRNGEKCADPLWTQAITKLVPQHPASYCLDCLGLMMEKRTAASQALKRQKPGSFTAVNGNSA
ncbi:hypothetical protein IQ06DRAFT_213093, partial [Phaeosphaeriaceae sp. SRC1lsM3a]